MALGTKGTLFVGSIQAGKVHAVRFRPGAAAEVITLASGLRLPAGVAFRDGALYVSAIDRILRFDDIENRLADPQKPIVVNDHFPSDTMHGWKFIAFGPDGKLYVPVGAPCNVCEPDMDRFALLSRIHPDGSGYEVFARGIRNTVGFDWDPRTKELWFNDHGRDWLGDDSPPDELNHARKPGMHFSYPVLSARDDRRSNMAAGIRAAISAACCGNWGRTSRRWACASIRAPSFRGNTGTRSSSPSTVRGIAARRSAIASRWCAVENDKAVAYEAVRDRLAAGESAWGRPADVLVMPDGSLLVSDDYAGAIYRISYRGP
jgi:glucose/arabinose dehydrogenase